MKTTICYFSFGPDGQALLESVKSVRRTYGNDVGICVFDDGTNPIDPALLHDIHPDLYEKTTFERKGNLNGPECVLGMLFAMQRAVTATKADIIVKVDCDTMILSDFLDYSRKWGLQGVWFATRSLVSGLCYALDASAPETILRNVAGRRIWQGNCPEDATISTLAAVYLPGGLRILDSSYDLPGPLTATGYNYKTSNPLELYKKYSIVTFGNRGSIDSRLTPDQKRQYAASRMHRLNDYLEKDLQHSFPPVA